MQADSDDGRRGKTHEDNRSYPVGEREDQWTEHLRMDEHPKGPGSETLSRQLKEDSSSHLHGTNGGTVLITGKIGQTYTASIKNWRVVGVTAYVGIGQDGNGTELGVFMQVFDI